MSVTGVSAAAFENDKYVAAFKGAIAATLANVDKDDISDVRVVASSSRRRLAETLVVAYDVVVFEEDLGGATADEFRAEVAGELEAAVESGAFATDLEAEAAASGDALVVAYAEATTVVDVVVAVAETADGDDDDDDKAPLVAGMDDTLVLAVGVAMLIGVLFLCGAAACTAPPPDPKPDPAAPSGGTSPVHEFEMSDVHRARASSKFEGANPHAKRTSMV